MRPLEAGSFRGEEQPAENRGGQGKRASSFPGAGSLFGTIASACSRAQGRWVWGSWGQRDGSTSAPELCCLVQWPLATGGDLN